MSTDKTQNKINITIYGKPNKRVTNFIYLGHKLTSSGDHEATLKHRIGLGWAAFQKHSTILKSKRVPTNVKVRTYLLYILPVVLYGLDCVTWNTSLSTQIEVFQNHCMRFITGHRLIEKTKITTLRELTSLPPLFDKVKSKTLKLFGHIKRSSVGLSKLCLEGMMEGKRSRGRPKRRWRDNILEWTSSENWASINQLSLDRVLWRNLSYVGSQSATSGSRDT